MGSAAASMMIAQQPACMLEDGICPSKSAHEVGAGANEKIVI